MPEQELFKGYYAIRNSVALEEETDMRCLLIKGMEAFKLMNRVCPCDVYLQNGQMKHTLLLDAKAIPFADVYVCRNREDAYLLGYWDASVDLMHWLNRHQGPFKNYSIIDLNQSYRFLSLNGPYAWELCAHAVGNEILGMPYLSNMSVKSGMIFRAGTTGEYGYHLMVPMEQKNEWMDNIRNTGKSFDLEVSESAARAQCSLENFFFDLNREGQYQLTPPELQLQWRLSQKKTEYPGSKAMENIREKGWDRRLTSFLSKQPFELNDEVYYENESVGQVISIGYSPVRKEFVGKALIRKPFWFPGLDCLHVNNQELKTISAPAIDNRSIYVNLHLDSYSTRNDDG